MFTINMSNLNKKAEFLSRFLKYSIVLDTSDDICYITFDYGCEGTDCVYAGTLKDSNEFLNRQLRKNGLMIKWKENRNK